MKKEQTQEKQAALDLAFKVVSKASAPGSWDC